MHTAGYAGIPAANAAMAVAKQVLAEPAERAGPVSAIGPIRPDSADSPGIPPDGDTPSS